MGGGRLSETGKGSRQLSGCFFGLVTMVLKTTKDWFSGM